MDREKDFSSTINETLEILSNSGPINRNAIMEMVDTRSINAANAVLKKVQNWGGFRIGSLPISRELGLPSEFVEKVMKLLARYDHLTQQSPGVYNFTPSLKEVDEITSRGTLRMKSDYYGSERSRYRMPAGFSVRGGLR